MGQEAHSCLGTSLSCGLIECKNKLHHTLQHNNTSI